MIRNIPWLLTKVFGLEKSLRFPCLILTSFKEAVFIFGTIRMIWSTRFLFMIHNYRHVSCWKWLVPFVLSPQGCLLPKSWIPCRMLLSRLIHRGIHLRHFSICMRWRRRRGGSGGGESIRRGYVWAGAAGSCFSVFRVWSALEGGFIHSFGEFLWWSKLSLDGEYPWSVITIWL